MRFFLITNVIKNLQLTTYYLQLLLLGTLTFQSCEPMFDTPTPSAGAADFSKYVAIGSSYSAGFTDGALSKYGQAASFPNLLAHQMQLAGGADTFNIPLLQGEKGTYPADDYGPGDFDKTLPRLQLVKEPDCKGEVALLPERIDETGDNEINMGDPSQRIFPADVQFHHLGIPAMKVIHYSSPGYGDVANFGTNKGFSPYFWRIAPEPLFLSSPFTFVAAIKPTFFTVELGMSDVLAYAIDGGIGKINDSYDEDITAVNAFRANLEFILDDLLETQGAQGVIANIPDVTTFPYFRRIIYDSLNLDVAKADSMNTLYPTIGYTFHEGFNPFVVKEDGVVRVIKSTEFVTLGIDIDSLKCLELGAFIPIKDVDILSEMEIANVRSFTVQFNTVIEELAAERGLAVVDLAGFMDEIYNETTISGIDFSAEMVSGAFFSLDGLHPTDRGQAMLTNEFIKVINQQYGAQLPALNISDYKGVLFP